MEQLQFHVQVGSFALRGLQLSGKIFHLHCCFLQCDVSMSDLILAGNGQEGVLFQELKFRRKYYKIDPKYLT